MVAKNSSKPTKSTKATTKSRKVAPAKYKSFRLHKRIKHPKSQQLSGSFSLFKSSVRHLLAHKRPFIGITVVYLLLTVLFVRGLGTSGELPLLKDALQEAFQGGLGQLATGVALFGVLVGSAGQATTEISSIYQAIILVLVSLALIWALRQTHAGTKVTTKESFYKSTHPLVPFLLVMLVIGLQLIPLAIGSLLFNAATSGGVAVTALEQLLWGSLFFLLALLTIYMLTSSLFALYVVTLPDTAPLQALRSTRKLVRYRRWTVMRKVLFLPIALLFVSALIVIPVILYLTLIAEWVFLVLSMAALAVGHSYMYSLYRELL